MERPLQESPRAMSVSTGSEKTLFNPHSLIESHESRGAARYSCLGHGVRRKYEARGVVFRFGNVPVRPWYQIVTASPSMLGKHEA
jgi:hypothetical protein